jgi:hypothetical protein
MPTQSNINATQIDETFPIAGQDNDTQGFRDNFNYIKNNLATAAIEITALENNTAKVNNDNDFGSKAITNATLRNNIDSILNGGFRNGAVVLNFANANYQRLALNGDISLTFEGYPTNGASSFILELIGDGTNRQVTFPNDGVTPVYKSNFPVDPIVISSTTKPVLFEIMTRTKNADPGALGRGFFIRYLGQYTATTATTVIASVTAAVRDGVTPITSFTVANTTVGGVTIVNNATFTATMPGGDQAVHTVTNVDSGANVITFTPSITPTPNWTLPANLTFTLP